LRFANIATNASQSRGVEGDQSRSENQMMKEHGRHLRLDDEAEKKLIVGASDCNWRPRTRDLFRDIVILMRDTGMRNERELYRCVSKTWTGKIE
jgi:hypothetical protein